MKMELWSSGQHPLNGSCLATTMGWQSQGREGTAHGHQPAARRVLGPSPLPAKPPAR